MRRILIATSNLGKLRDFASAATMHGVEVSGLPGFDQLPSVREDGDTFETNARKKAEFYSRYVPSEIVAADDSGLEVDALGGAPGVFSARYAGSEGNANSTDLANNAKLLQELNGVPRAQRTARFVCVIAVTRDGRTLATFRGEVAGEILTAPRGAHGFGYDPIFYFPPLGKSFAEMSAKEKAGQSHRGAAFERLLRWLESDSSNA